MKILYLYIPVFVLAMSSCTQNESLVTSGSTPVTVTGSLSQSSARTAYEEDDDAVICSWAAGDVIGMMSESQSTPLLYTALSDGGTTDFQPSGEQLENKDGERVFAWTPYHECDSITYPYVLLPDISRQSYNGGLPQSTHDFIYASGDISQNTLNLRFKHLFAFLEIVISKESLGDSDGFVLVADGDMTWSGDACYNMVDATVTAQEYSSRITYSIDDGLLESGDELKCYVAMLPSTNTISLYPLVTTGSGESLGERVMVKDAPSSGFQAGNIYYVNVQEAYSLTVSETNVEVEAAGGAFSLVVKSCKDFDVNVSADWVSVSYGEENGTRTVVNVTVDETTSEEDRTGTVTFTSGDIERVVTVKQAGGYLELSQTEVDVDVNGGTFTVDIKSNVSYTVSISDSWLSQDSSGAFTAAASSSAEARTATITVSWANVTRKVTVTQEGGYLEVSPAEVSVPSDGGSFSVSVKSNVDFAVTISGSWLSQKSSSAAGGTTTKTYTAAANDGTETRTATISISWSSLVRTVTVTQEGKVSTEGTGIDRMPVEEW